MGNGSTGMKFRRYSIDDYNNVVALYSGGKTTKEVSALTGIATSNVKRWIKKAGITRTRFVPQEIKDEIVRLYVEEGMTAREIGARVGMSEPAVGTHLHNSGKRRSLSEAQALAANKRPYKKGKGGYWQSAKTGKWVYAMSIMEMLRMQQLDNDPTVKTWDRFVPAVDWQEGKYVADLMVWHTDGTVVVEEVKPSSQHYYEENQKKWQAAISHFSAQGVSFRVVSEKDLGGETAIRSFRHDGLQRIDENERKQRKKAVYQAYRERKICHIKELNKERYEKYKSNPEVYSAIRERSKLSRRAKRAAERKQQWEQNLSFAF